MTSRLAVLFDAMAGSVLPSIFAMTVVHHESIGGDFTYQEFSNQQLQHNMQPAASFGYEANTAMVPSKNSMAYVCALLKPCMAGLMLAVSGIASSAWLSLFLDQCCDVVLTDSQSTRCTRALSVISTLFAAF